MLRRAAALSLAARQGARLAVRTRHPSVVAMAADAAAASPTDVDDVDDADAARRRSGGGGSTSHDEVRPRFRRPLATAASSPPPPSAHGRRPLATEAAMASSELSISSPSLELFATHLPPDCPPHHLAAILSVYGSGVIDVRVGRRPDLTDGRRRRRSPAPPSSSSAGDPPGGPRAVANARHSPVSPVLVSPDSSGASGPWGAVVLVGERRTGDAAVLSLHRRRLFRGARAPFEVRDCGAGRVSLLGEPSSLIASNLLLSRLPNRLPTSRSDGQRLRLLPWRGAISPASTEAPPPRFARLSPGPTLKPAPCFFRGRQGP